jgi:hypothetical protein
MVACLSWVVRIPVAVQEAPDGEWLAVASVLVSVATLASIAFAVVVYFEARALRSLVDVVRGEVQQQRRETLQEVRDHRDAFYDVSLECVRALLHTFALQRSTASRKEIVSRLRLAEIKVHLSHGTRESLLAAIKLAYQYHPDMLLQMQGDIWERSSTFDKKQRESLRDYYLELRKPMLRDRHVHHKHDDAT